MRPSILLIQGVGLVGEGWRPQVDDLSDAFEPVTFDNRGIGAGPALDGPLTIEQMAADALAVMDRLGVDRFHVVGHSMGGVIAQDVALRWPERVASLALVCTFAHGAQATSLTLPMIVTGLRTRVGSRRMRRRAFLEMVYPPSALVGRDTDALARELEPLFGHDLADQPPVVMKQLGAMSRYDARHRLAGLGTISTLVVSGELDRIARPAFGRELASAIPGARYVELPGAAHGVPIHDAPAINRLLREHIGGGLRRDWPDQERGARRATT